MELDRQYRTSNGGLFDARNVPDAIGLFDAERWSDCAHAVMFALTLIGDPAESHAAVRDYGVLHELNHLVTLGHVGHRMAMAELRALVAAVHERAHGTRGVA